MFTELKEGKYLKQTTMFVVCLRYKSYNVKYFKEIKRLKSPQKAEAYLEPKRISMMELFCECTERLTIFVKKAPS